MGELVDRQGPLSGPRSHPHLGPLLQPSCRSSGPRMHCRESAFHLRDLERVSIAGISRAIPSTHLSDHVQELSFNEPFLCWPPLLAGWVTWGKSFHCSEPQFLFLYLRWGRGDLRIILRIKCHNISIYVKCAAQCQAHSQHSG